MATPSKNRYRVMTGQLSESGRGSQKMPRHDRVARAQAKARAAPALMHLALRTNRDTIEIELPLDTSDVITEQIERISDAVSRAAFVQTVLRHFTNCLSDLFEPDLKPPTERQIALAVALSKAKRVPIPRDALINRYVMGDFISQQMAKKSDRQNHQR